MGMDDPGWMAKVQASMDAQFAFANGTPRAEAIESITVRMRELFGENVKRSLVAARVVAVYAGTSEGDHA